MIQNLAAADSPAEHLQLAAFCLLVTVAFVWFGRAHRTGRNPLADGLVRRVGGPLAPEPPPSRRNRAMGCVFLVAACLFFLGFAGNAILAVTTAG